VKECRLGFHSWRQFRLICLTMRRRCGRGLGSGTSWERMGPESLTPPCSLTFTATSRGGAGCAALDQVYQRATSDGFATDSLNFDASRSRIRTGRESTGFSGAPLPPLQRGSPKRERRPRTPPPPPPRKGEGSRGTVRKIPPASRHTERSLLPPPLRGRVGVGGAPGDTAAVDPHPRPLPARGRGAGRPRKSITASSPPAAGSAWSRTTSLPASPARTGSGSPGGTGPARGCRRSARRRSPSCVPAPGT